MKRKDKRSDGAAVYTLGRFAIMGMLVAIVVLSACQKEGSSTMNEATQNPSSSASQEETAGSAKAENTKSCAAKTASPSSSVGKEDPQLKTYPFGNQSDFPYTGIPDIVLKLNGVSLKNQELKHPLLVYQNIPYFPLSLQTAGFLGVKMTGSPQEGIDLERVEKSLTPEPDMEKATSLEKQESFQMGAIPIQVRQDPLFCVASLPPIVFRDTLYLPMLQESLQEQLGWDFHQEEDQSVVVESNFQIAEKRQNDPKQTSKEKANGILKTIGLSLEFPQEWEGKYLLIPEYNLTKKSFSYGRGAYLYSVHADTSSGYLGRIGVTKEEYWKNNADHITDSGYDVGSGHGKIAFFISAGDPNDPSDAAYQDLQLLQEGTALGAPLWKTLKILQP